MVKIIKFNLYLPKIILKIVKFNNLTGDSVTVTGNFVTSLQYYLSNNSDLLKNF